MTTGGLRIARFFLILAVLAITARADVP